MTEKARMKQSTRVSPAASGSSSSSTSSSDSDEAGEEVKSTGKKKKTTPASAPPAPQMFLPLAFQAPTAMTPPKPVTVLRAPAPAVMAPPLPENALLAPQQLTVRELQAQLDAALLAEAATKEKEEKKKKAAPISVGSVEKLLREQMEVFREEVLLQLAAKPSRHHVSVRTAGLDDEQKDAKIAQLELQLAKSQRSRSPSTSAEHTKRSKKRQPPPTSSGGPPMSQIPGHRLRI